MKAEVTLKDEAELKGKTNEELAELVGPWISQERAKRILKAAIADGKLPDYRDPVVVGVATWGRVMVTGFEDRVKEATKREGVAGGGQKAIPVSVDGVVAGTGPVEIDVPDTDKELKAKEEKKPAKKPASKDAKTKVA
jgi:hypothetical protein